MLTRNRYPAQGFCLVKFEENRSAMKRGIALLIFIQISLIFPRLLTRYYRHVYGKMKTVNVAFLRRLIPSDAINKFFVLVCNSELELSVSYLTSDSPFSHTSTVIFAVFASKHYKMASGTVERYIP